MTQTIEKKITLCDHDLNLWLEEAIAFHKIR
jgi:alpha-D-ribose 1-methylphosphonate 5-triphosphate synthase subunit PhnH